MTYSETIREILKKRREREQLQEQILLEFPKKVNAIDVNWLEQFSFNSGYFEKIMERKELLSPFIKNTDPHQLMLNASLIRST